MVNSTHNAAAQIATADSIFPTAKPRFGEKALAEFAIALAILSVVPTMAWADVPMYLVVTALKLNALPILIFVVLIEAAALCWIFSFTWKNSFLTSFYANAFSMALGMIVYPLVGGLFYLALAPIVIQTIGGSLSIEVIATFIGVSVLDTLIELPFIARIRKVRVTVWSVIVFFAANLIGMAVLAAALVDYDELLQPPIHNKIISQIEEYYEPEIGFMEQIFDELEDVYASSDEISNSEWAAKTEEEAQGYRFRWLTVSKQYQYSILKDDEKLHSTAQQRDTSESQYRRDKVRVWRTMSQNGVWFYVYEIRASWSNQEPRVRAWFDPP